MTGPHATALRFELVVAPSIPLALPDPLPDGGARTWAPITSTLLLGEHDAVLIDPPLTLEQADAVGHRLESLERRLTCIVVTHAHGDHWFTAATIAERLGGVEVVARAGVIEAMHRANDSRAGFWDRILPGRIPASPVIAVEAPDDEVELEGHRIRLLGAGRTDTDPTAVVHVPDLDLVVAGDVVYDDAHLFLVESDKHGRDAWRGALNMLEALDPAHLVAGHATRSVDIDPRRGGCSRRRGGTWTTSTSSSAPIPPRPGRTPRWSSATRVERTPAPSGAARWP